MAFKMKGHALPGIKQKSPIKGSGKEPHLHTRFSEKAGKKVSLVFGGDNERHQNWHAENEQLATRAEQESLKNKIDEDSPAKQNRQNDTELNRVFKKKSPTKNYKKGYYKK